MLEPDGRFDFFRDTTYQIWRRNDRILRVPMSVEVGMEPWARRVAEHNRVPTIDVLTDALMSGSLMVGAVAVGLRVGVTTDGKNFPSDFTDIFGGPMGEVTSDKAMVEVPIGVIQLADALHHTPESATYYGMCVMHARAHLGGPGALVMAAVGEEPNCPPQIHEGGAMAVPFSRLYELVSMF
jgi:hypothetical protein